MASQTELFEMLRAYQQSALLIALVELDLATALATYPQGATALELAHSLKLQVRPLEALLMAAATIGLLEAQHGRYRNSELSRQFLAKNSPQYKGDPVRSALDQYLGYAKLAHAVREGSQVLPNLQNQVAVAGHDPALRRLILGLHSGGKQLLPLLMPPLAPYLAKAHRLLDVGCGAGTYALAFAEHNPQLEITLLDQPSVLEIAAEVVAESAARERVRWQSADYRQDDFGTDEFDMILFFQVLRTEPVATIQALLHKAARALAPGGIIVVYDTWLEESRTDPAENVFQNLTLALTYAEGGLFTPGELGEWLEQAGFAPAQVWPLAAARPMLLALSTRKETL